MPEMTSVNDAQVTTKGRVTIPQSVLASLGISPGDRITFITEEGSVRIVNSIIYAFQKFQEQMRGEAEKAGLLSEEDIDNWITQSRREEAKR